MSDFSVDIDNCLQVLHNGGIILYPTDTIWGLGCDATNAEAVEKIYAIKNRNDNKALIVLLADERDVMKHVAALDLHIFDYLQTVDKPTSVIYDGAIGFADNLVHQDGSVAIRIVKDEFCKHLIKRFRKPIVSTSANISGMLSPVNFTSIEADIKKRVDYIVTHKQNDTSTATASRVVKWKKGKLEMIRE